MNILIVDDDNLVSLSLKTILETTEDINVVALGANGQEATELYEKHNPDVLLMDIRMETMSGLEASEIILGRHPEAKILLLTTFLDDEYVVKAIKLGAKGYILKQEFESIAPALRAVYNGQTVFGDEIMNKIPSLLAGNEAKSCEATRDEYKISDKEFDIIKLVADGLNNKEISSTLYLSEGTVRNYISTILEKLELRDRTQLAVFFFKKLS